MFSEKSLVLMADNSYKMVSNLQEGDMVMGCDIGITRFDDNEDFYNIDNFKPTKVVKVVKRFAIAYEFDYKDHDYPNLLSNMQKFLSSNREWVEVFELLNNKDYQAFVLVNDEGYISNVHPFELSTSNEIYNIPLYYIQTESGTMVVSNLVCLDSPNSLKYKGE